MISCPKRQKIVKRTAGDTVHRCMNRECGLYGQKVDEGACSRCPSRPQEHKPCPKLNVPQAVKQNAPPVLPQEMLLDINDAELREMAAAAGMDMAEIDQMQKAEIGQAEYPAFTVQLWSYKEALLKWAQAGRPKRTQEEVEQIHSTYCNPLGSPCEWYDSKQNRCKGCGCKVTVGSLAIFNKIAMATEHCPREKW